MALESVSAKNRYEILSGTNTHENNAPANAAICANFHPKSMEINTRHYSLAHPSPAPKVFILAAVGRCAPVPGTPANGSYPYRNGKRI